MRSTLGHFLALWTLMIAVGSSPLYAADAQTKIARSGTTVVRAITAGGPVTVTIRTAIFDRTCKCSCPAEKALKELDIKEMSIVQALEISVHGRSITVPGSVYEHLFETHKASLQYEKGNFDLRIDGMDASNSYFVRIYFNHTEVTRYVTYWGLVPDKPTSDTRYFRVEFPWK